MKNRLMSISEKLLLKKRALIERVIDQLKHISQIEHTRHRSVSNFLVNVVCAFIAYTYQEKKPSLNIRQPAEDRRFICCYALNPYVELTLIMLFE